MEELLQQEPSYIDELTRKTLETLIRLEERKQAGEVNEREYAVALQTVFSVTAGLTREFVSNTSPMKILQEMVASIDKSDASFLDYSILRSGFDDKFVGVTIKNENAVIFTGTITQTALKTAKTDETNQEFKARIETALKTKFANYEEWKWQ